jgi:hypothetical protein
MAIFDHLLGIEFRMTNLIRINPQRPPVRRSIPETHYYFSLAADLPVKAL